MIQNVYIKILKIQLSALTTVQNDPKMRTTATAHMNHQQN